PAVEGVFARMNAAFYARGIDFPDANGMQARAASMAEFLVRSDAIFSLNQDLLLEQKYIANGAVSTARAARIHAAMPGVPMPPGLGPLPQDWAAARFRVGQPEIGKNCQPFFKLHGSVQWRDANDASVMVLGSAKREAIAAHPTLAWYFAQFEQRLAA